jgi:hypothetical protein
MTYEKNGQLLEEADQFLYEEEIYLDFPPTRWELFRIKKYSSKTPINKKDARAFSESHGCYVQRYWEMIAAPKQYLIEEGFKLKL